MENEVLAKAVVASKFRSSKLDIRIKKEIKAKEIHNLLDEIFKLHGCPACGLNGLDLRLIYENPIDNLINVAGVAGAAYGR